MIRSYELGKRGKADVNMVVVPQEPPPGFKAKFTFRSLGGNVLQAIGIVKPAEEPAKSTQLAKERRRGRLFEHVTLGADPPATPSGLGNIQSIDEALSKEPK
jgi:hypothetical protein